MKSIISLILALLGIMVFGVIGGCSTDNDSATTSKRETTSYYTTRRETSRFEETMESLKDDASEMFSEASSDIKDVLPDKENGVITTKRGQ